MTRAQQRQLAFEQWEQYCNSAEYDDRVNSAECMRYLNKLAAIDQPITKEVLLEPEEEFAIKCVADNCASKDPLIYTWAGILMFKGVHLELDRLKVTKITKIGDGHYSITY